jgi:hypothetical protein
MIFLLFLIKQKLFFAAKPQKNQNRIPKLHDQKNIF